MAAGERAKILLVDDDPDVVALLAFVVEQAGYIAFTAQDGVSALDLFERERPDVAVIDINLGRSSGFELLEQLRRRSDLPIILLSARGSEDDKVRGLELGADDYVVKPFGNRELVSRIRVNVRRAMRTEHGPLTVGPLTIDPDHHSVAIAGREVALTATEFRLLYELMRKPGVVVPTKVLTRRVWGQDDVAAREVLRVTLYRLRRKLGEDASQPTLLQTLPGVGLSLRPLTVEGAGQAS